MDFVIAGLQGAGLALAAGAFFGAAGQREVLGAVLAVCAVAAGAYLWGLSLTSDFGVADVADDDHPAWPGWLVGGLFAIASYNIWRGVSAAAGSREGAGAGIALFIAGGAALAGALSLVLPFAGALVIAACIWLALGRRRRAGEKYEGLRSLR